MRRHDKEIKDPEILEEILLKSEVYRLGLTEFRYFIFLFTGNFHLMLNPHFYNDLQYAV